jgi:hypothetical protein
MVLRHGGVRVELLQLTGGFADGSHAGDFADGLLAVVKADIV